MAPSTPPTEADQPTSKPRSEAAATYVAPTADAPPIIPIGQSDNVSDNPWAYYQGSGRDVRDPQNDPQYVEVAGSVVRVPTPPQPSRREGESTADQEENSAPGKGKGHGQSKGKWRPVLNPQETQGFVSYISGFVSCIPPMPHLSRKQRGTYRPILWVIFSWGRRCFFGVNKGGD